MKVNFTGWEPKTPEDPQVQSYQAIPRALPAENYDSHKALGLGGGPRSGAESKERSLANAIVQSRRGRLGGVWEGNSLPIGCK